MVNMDSARNIKTGGARQEANKSVASADVVVNNGGITVRRGLPSSMTDVVEEDD